MLFRLRLLKVYWLCRRHLWLNILTEARRSLASLFLSIHGEDLLFVALGS